jgi:hypothetical protein
LPGSGPSRGPQVPADVKNEYFRLVLEEEASLVVELVDDPLLLDSLSVAADDDCLVVDLLAVAHYNHDSDIGRDLVIPVCEFLHHRLDLISRQVPVHVDAQSDLDEELLQVALVDFGPSAGLVALGVEADVVDDQHLSPVLRPGAVTVIVGVAEFRRGRHLDLELLAAHGHFGGGLLDYVVGQLVATGGVLEGAADRLFVLQLVGQLFEFVLAEASDQLVEDGGRRLQQLEEDAAVVVAAIVLEFYVVHDPGDVGVLAGETPHHPLQITVADQLDEIFINQTFVFWQHRVLSRFFSIYLF